ncbi:glycosyltransferase family 61 protein [Desulfosediminicola ganghwensis]|uniref:glycosyltransferase family 61 protein n=1 Tax=Desulfosediminicola ganghwensis TaxID=2569540 RepID=UPI0010AD64D5|nr:glycosyltransferase 61 family protein [Desulfosediminicola ganghwensis]
MQFLKAILTKNSGFLDPITHKSICHLYRIRNGKVDNLKSDFPLRDVYSQPTKTIQEPVFYAGTKFDHYGHFILESLARLSNYNGSPPLVWHCNEPGFKNWQKEILSFWNLNKRKHIFITKPTLFEKIKLTEPQYLIWDKFTDQHNNFMSVIDKNDNIFENRKIWLSRNSNRTNFHPKTFNNEEEIEALLTMRGWVVVNPLDLSIKKQVSLFYNAKHIAGIEGSAFHSLIFCKKIPAKVTIFTRKKQPNGNFTLIDKIKNSNQNFHYCRLGKSLNPKSVLNVLFRDQEPKLRLLNYLSSVFQKIRL